MALSRQALAKLQQPKTVKVLGRIHRGRETTIKKGVVVDFKAPPFPVGSRVETTAANPAGGTMVKQGVVITAAETPGGWVYAVEWDDGPSCPMRGSDLRAVLPIPDNTMVETTEAMNWGLPDQPQAIIPAGTRGLVLNVLRDDHYEVRFLDDTHMVVPRSKLKPSPVPAVGPATLVLVQYDNGESHDDWRIYPICILTTEQAEELKPELEAHVAAMRKTYEDAEEACRLLREQEDNYDNVMKRSDERTAQWVADLLATPDIGPAMHAALSKHTSCVRGSLTFVPLPSQVAHQPTKLEEELAQALADEAHLLWYIRSFLTNGDEGPLAKQAAESAEATVYKHKAMLEALHPRGIHAHMG